MKRRGVRTPTGVTTSWSALLRVLIRILGSKATLEQVIAGRTVGSAGVRSYEWKWRARQDSNLWPPPSGGAVARAAGAGDLEAGAAV